MADTGGGGFGGNLGKSFGGGKDEKPVLADLSQQMSALSGIRGNLETPFEPNLQEEDTSSTEATTVTNPLIDQLVKHFGEGPETADGELGQSLKDRGF